MNSVIPSQNPLLATIQVNGHDFIWTSADGLERTAVFELTGFIRKTAQRYMRPGIEFLDLVQAGYLGALRAAKTYRPDSGAAFITWASHRMIDEIKRELRLIKTLTISLDNATTDDNETPLAERISDGRDYSEEFITQLDFTLLLAKYKGDNLKAVKQWLNPKDVRQHRDRQREYRAHCGLQELRDMVRKRLTA